MSRKSFRFILLLAVTALVVQPLAATTMLQMDLAALTERAGRIFRGTVVDVEQTTIAAGGGELPAVAYRFKVEELFKGEANLVKGDQAIIEIKMVGSIKQALPVDGVVRFDKSGDVPQLEMGSDYLLFSTAESPIGLSVTVGLGQGAFSVFSVGKEDFAVNEFNNKGLGLDSAGPAPYDEIAAKVLTLLGQ
jgi:hypothetical protein